MKIHYRFDERKATQAAAFLVKKAGDKMTKLRLIKLLYFAERESLSRHGVPIIGDRYVSMNAGPVLSRVLNLINYGDELPGAKVWSDHLETMPEHRIALIADPGEDYLSEDQRQMLLELHERTKSKATKVIVDESHDLPEWQDPNGSSVPIHVEDILRALGKTEAQIQKLQEEAAEDLALDEILEL